MKFIVVVLALGLASCAGGLNSRGSSSGASAAAGGSSAASCTAAGDATASGGMSCQDGTYYRCSNGVWQQTALSCAR